LIATARQVAKSTAACCSRAGRHERIARQNAVTPFAGVRIQPMRRPSKHYKSSRLIGCAFAENPLLIQQKMSPSTSKANGKSCLSRILLFVIANDETAVPMSALPAAKVKK
jgi:hypothetical protein